jgi:arylsulfatase A-like enzyme
VKLTSNETGRPTTRAQGDVLRERYAEITAMDRAIGTLREHLATTSLRDDTLLFYCGDNGTSADGSLVTPHRGVKGQVYDGGILVPGLIEWPARIPHPRSTKIRASTSDLLPTLCALVGQPLPTRPIDGIDLTPLLDDTMTERSNPLFFWDFANRTPSNTKPVPYIDPELQEGTTPLAKLSGGKATRDFTNFRHPTITEADYLGSRAIIDGPFKLVMHEQKEGDTKLELFDLQADPAEKSNLIDELPAVRDKLQARLRQWQSSVLNSLTGSDYQHESRH